MKNLYIDSNVWLSLYHFSSDDLDEFRKLKNLVPLDINLLIPSQTRDEVIRNRDAKLKTMLDKFEKFDLSFPVFSKKYDIYPAFVGKYQELKQLHKTWVTQIKTDIEGQCLPADDTINEFFERERILNCNQDVIRRAELRYKAGNPPGKDNKLGDAINWECILENVSDGEDLYIISGDRDFTSVIDKDSFNLFLQREWEEKKHGHIHFFKSLIPFLNQHASDIRLQHQQEQDQYIKELADSNCFETTHLVIRKLNNYSEWTPIQQEDLLSAAIHNSQVKWIIQDNDVKQFYSRLLDGIAQESESVTTVRQLLEEAEDDVVTEDAELW